MIDPPGAGTGLVGLPAGSRGATWLGRLRTRRRLLAGVGSVVVCALVVYLIITPLAALVFTAFNGSATGLDLSGPMSLVNFLTIASSSGSVSLVVNTVLYAVCTVILTLVLTVLIAYLIDRCDLPAKATLRLLILGPLGIPPIVLAVAWGILGNPTSGLLNDLGLHIDVMTLPGMVFVTSIVLVPSMYLMLSGQMAQLDSSLEEAAAVSGVGLVQRTLRVTLALVRPVLLGAVMFYLVIALEAFDVGAILGIPRNVYIFSTVIYSEIGTGGIPHYGIASAYGMVLVVLSLGLVFAYRRLSRGGDRYRVVSGKSYRYTQIKLRKWKIPAIIFVVMVSVVATLAPLAVLVWSSLLPFYGDLKENLAAHLTLRNYVGVFTSEGFLAAAWHTLVIAAVAATLTILLATWGAWMVDRRGSRLARVAVDGGFFVLGVPGIVLATAVLFWYLVLPRLSIPLPLYGTIWILVVAYVTRFMAYSGRLMDSAVRQFDHDLEDVAYVSGVRPSVVARRITLPLLLPAMARGWVWVMVHVIRDVPVAVILVTAASQTLAALLWQSWSTATTITSVSAFAVILTAISMLGTLAMSRFFRARGGEVSVGL